MSRRPHPPELCARAVELRAEGMIYQDIAAELGVARSTVAQWFVDPDGSKSRERKKRYAGTCEGCGGPTDGSNGHAKASERCQACRDSRYAERNARLVELWEAGVPTPEIASRLGMTEVAVRSWVDRARHRCGMDISLRKRRHRELWPDIERLWNEGLTGPEIAQRLGITEGNFYFMVQTMRAKGVDLPYRYGVRAAA